jgi:8-oxo-dGTP diphosphatase
MNKIRVAAAIIRKDNEVLLARRCEGQKLAGYWEFPGGKIEPYETPQECAEREIFEELGIRIEAGSIFSETAHTYDDLEVELVGVEARMTGGTLTPTVHDRVELVDISDLARYKLAPADLPIIGLLQKKKLL